MIGVTERGDPCNDKSWIAKLDQVDYVTLVTKGVALITHDILKYKDKILLHCTCTGWGGTRVEPNVPTIKQTVIAINYLIQNGFDPARIVLRLDPIIPIEAGIKQADKVLTAFNEFPITRVRVSVIDRYDHVAARFHAAKLKFPFDSFRAPDDMMRATEELLKKWSNRYKFESCAETLRGADPVGCISGRDCKLMGIDTALHVGGKQRKGCLCAGEKMELLSNPAQCQNGCLYCYWQKDCIFRKAMAATGHRPKKFPFKYNEKDPVCKALKRMIMLHIMDAYDQGIRDFISGMALGVDTWFAECVLWLKDYVPDVRLICAVPYVTQYDTWIEESRVRWHNIINAADQVIYLSETYTEECMQDRNVWMADHADKILSVWDESPGGTGNCVQYVDDKGINRININPNKFVAPDYDNLLVMLEALKKKYKGA